VLIHGADDSGWYWHLVEDELRGLGHDTVAPDLPVERSPTLVECADAVVRAAETSSSPVAVVAQSFGSFVGPLVAERLPTQVLVPSPAWFLHPVSRPTTGGSTPATRTRSASRRRSTEV
jgi:pimeloyl-ACP methyl ester carboxylesterase